MLLTILSCKRTLSQLDDYLDRELSPSEMKGVRVHLAICHACEEKFAFEARFVEAMREHIHTVVALEESTQTSALERVWKPLRARPQAR